VTNRGTARSGPPARRAHAGPARQPDAAERTPIDARIDATSHCLVDWRRGPRRRAEPSR
jgi:hypothetical protein